MNKIERIEFIPKETVDDRLWTMMVRFNEAVDVVNTLLDNHLTIKPSEVDNQECGKHISGGMTCANPKGQCILHDVLAQESGETVTREDWEETFRSRFFWKDEDNTLMPVNTPELIGSQKKFIRTLLSQAVQDELARLREGVKQLHGGGYIHHEEPFVSENGVLSLLDNDTME